MQALFTWLDHSVWFYWLAAGLASVSLVAWVIAAWVALDQKNEPKSDWVSSSVLLLAVLAVWRWPMALLSADYNPDEGQILAGSITLTRDPVFWRSVDGTTSGPLNFYALLPLHWFGLPIDFQTARLVGLLLVWIAIVACYQGLKSVFGELAGRLGALPAIAFFSFVHEWDYVHYSSEHVSLAILASSIALLVSDAQHRDSSRWRTAVALILAGALPWAKLQAGPLGLLLVLWAWWLNWDLAPNPGGKIWQTLKLACWAAVPTVGMGLMIFLTGQGDVFFENYVVQNLFYAGEGSTLGETLGGLLLQAKSSLLLPAFLVSQGIMLAVGAALSFRSRTLPRQYWWMGASFTLVAAISVLLPLRAFLHYTLFLIVPLTIWGGAVIGEWLPRFRLASGARVILPIALITGLLIPAVARMRRAEPIAFGRLAYDWKYPRSPLGNVLFEAAEPGDQLIVWGWYARLYVESQLPQGTKVGYSYWSIYRSPLLAYHRKILLDDMKSSRPVFFVDSVGPGSYHFQDRASQGHEIFPELQQFVAENYVLLADFTISRLYVRRDQLGRAALTRAAVEKAVAAGRPYELRGRTKLPVIPPIYNPDLALLQP